MGGWWGGGERARGVQAACLKVVNDNDENDHLEHGEQSNLVGVEVGVGGGNGVRVGAGVLGLG